VLRTSSLGLALFGVWLCWSGYFTPFLLTLGVLSCLGVLALAHRMGLIDAEGAPFELTLRALVYLPWLLWEIVKANVDVARRVLHPRMPISPRIIRVPASQQTNIGRVIFANSITLTPGTISLRVDDDVITVHALTRQAAESLLQGEMDRRARWVEGGE